MWFTIVYFADHYVADIIVGVAVALSRGGSPGASSRPAGALAGSRRPLPAPLASARTFGGPT